MEKDIDRIPKNPDTDIVIRVDDFGGKRGLTIREFVKSDRYTGFTKAGTRIPAEHFKNFKAAINSIDEADFMDGVGGSSSVSSGNVASNDNNESSGEEESDSGEEESDSKKENEGSEEFSEAAI